MAKTVKKKKSKKCNCCGCISTSNKSEPERPTPGELRASIQLGLLNAISGLPRLVENDLLVEDFAALDTYNIPARGGRTTLDHDYSDFTFQTFAPMAFKCFLRLYGIQEIDFLKSLCEHHLRQLSNAGVSGSLFYITADDIYIVKTVSRAEAKFFRRLMVGYFINLNQNPHTFLPKFFGHFRYQCFHKQVGILVMNNLLPTKIKIHMKFDLKGSTYKRKANEAEMSKSVPTLKDLDFKELLPNGLYLKKEIFEALSSTLRRDARVLESFNIMDYSLLLGIHNIDKSEKDEESGSNLGITSIHSSTTSLRDMVSEIILNEDRRNTLGVRTTIDMVPPKVDTDDKGRVVVPTSRVYQEHEYLPEGGIEATNEKGERLILFVGIIDILQSYTWKKKIEHNFKSIVTDGDCVSVHTPKFYAERFLKFLLGDVFKAEEHPKKSKQI